MLCINAGVEGCLDMDACLSGYWYGKRCVKGFSAVCLCLLEDMERENKRVGAFLLFYILSSSAESFETA